MIQLIRWTLLLHVSICWYSVEALLHPDVAPSSCISRRIKWTSIGHHCVRDFTLDRQRFGSNETFGNLNTKNVIHMPRSFSRRNLFTATASSSVLPLWIMLGTTNDCYAAPPLIANELEQWPARVERQFLRPKPRRLLRPQLNLDFAVFLMRTSYNALDELDCVAMDQFQRDFFLLRQSEYQPYTQQLGGGGIQQGMLQDPYYFDFISFAQYATIAREMRDNPPIVFEEQQPDPNAQVESEDADPTTTSNRVQKFVPVIVRRKEPYMDNARLPMQHDRIVGDAIVERFEGMYRSDMMNQHNNTNGDTLNGIERNSRPVPDVVLASLQQLVKLFVVNGFALDGSASYYATTNNKEPSNTTRNASGTTFILKLQSPATLWSGKSLQQRNSNPTNDFLRKAASSLLLQEGYAMASDFTIKYTPTEEITTFQII